MIGWGGGVSFPKILQREVKQNQRNPPITFGTKLKVYFLCHFIQCWERGKLLKEEQQTTADQTCPFNAS